LVILSAALLGGPVSTTQVVSGVIIGTGTAENVRKIRWNLAANIVTAWILTIPFAAIVAAAMYFCGQTFDVETGRSLMNLFKNPLKPRQDRSIERLIHQASACVTGLSGLVEFARVPSEETAKIVHDAEELGDEERRLLVDELNRTFVTPIDREDLFALSRAIDDILDYAYTTVDEMMLFKLQSNIYVTKMAEVLLTSGKEIHVAMQRLLEHPNVASEHAVRAKQHENQVEKLYREATACLFHGKVETVDGVMEVLKLREVYRHLSNAADRVDTAANIISDVIMKIM